MKNQDINNKYIIIPMTAPEESSLIINYEFYDSIYGNILIAASEKGINFIGLGDEKELLEELKKRYNKALIIKQTNIFHTIAINQIMAPWSKNDIAFHIKGTDFQLKVWGELLNIFSGNTCSYKQIAEKIGHPAATRAVGTAVGQNPVSFLIPCHRVIRSDGSLGGYYWGTEVKKQILQHESVK